jgi:hypothetical protein
MRFALHNAATMLAILLPCAAAAPAGMVEISTLQTLELEPPRTPPGRTDDGSVGWFPNVMPSEPAALPAPIATPPRASAILIPLPTPVWIGAAGVACALVAAAAVVRRRKLAA